MARAMEDVPQAPARHVVREQPRRRRCDQRNQEAHQGRAQADGVREAADRRIDRRHAQVGDHQFPARYSTRFSLLPVRCGRGFPLRLLFLHNFFFSAPQSVCAQRASCFLCALSLLPRSSSFVVVEVVLVEEEGCHVLAQRPHAAAPRRRASPQTNKGMAVL